MTWARRQNRFSAAMAALEGGHNTEVFYGGVAAPPPSPACPAMLPMLISQGEGRG